MVTVTWVWPGRSQIPNSRISLQTCLYQTTVTTWLWSLWTINSFRYLYEVPELSLDEATAQTATPRSLGGSFKDEEGAEQPSNTVCNPQLQFLSEKTDNTRSAQAALSPSAQLMGNFSVVSLQPGSSLSAVMLWNNWANALEGLSCKSFALLKHFTRQLTVCGIRRFSSSNPLFRLKQMQ